MSYSHLATFERGKLEALHQMACPARQIAKTLNRHHSTVSRELHRNRGTIYTCEKANESYRIRRERSIPKGKVTSSLIQIIEEKLACTWSPEQIQGRLLEGKISFKTIYRWLYKVCFPVEM